MSASLVELEVQPAPNGIVARLRGEIDLSNAQDLGLRIERAAASAPEVVLDLTEIEFMDSQGVRLLYTLSTWLSGRDARLVVVAPADGIAGELLALTQATDVFTVRESLH